MYYIGHIIGQIIGQVARKGCLKLYDAVKVGLISHQPAPHIILSPECP